MNEHIEGWRFYTADFSSLNAPGHVTYKRSVSQTRLWHLLSEEEQDLIHLYYKGEGLTLESAIKNAKEIIAKVRNIPNREKKL